MRICPSTKAIRWWSSMTRKSELVCEQLRAPKNEYFYAQAWCSNDTLFVLYVYGDHHHRHIITFKYNNHRHWWQMPMITIHGNKTEKRGKVKIYVCILSLIVCKCSRQSTSLMSAWKRNVYYQDLVKRTAETACSNQELKVLKHIDYEI